MADLRTLLEDLHFKEVQTYIQSGNVVFKTDMDQEADIEDKIKVGIHGAFGFDVPVLVRTKKDIERIIAANPFRSQEILNGNMMYYVLLKRLPKKELINSLENIPYENEKCKVIDDCAYLVCFKGAGKAKLNNNIIENKLQVPATTRNHRTMLKLLEMT